MFPDLTWLVFSGLMAAAVSTGLLILALGYNQTWQYVAAGTIGGVGMVIFGAISIDGLVHGDLYNLSVILAVTFLLLFLLATGFGVAFEKPHVPPSQKSLGGPDNGL